ncbi:MAG: hypothetical protein QOJ86_4016 [Bradyrhizobium sp.]|jgi:hypothetical protein|nr:hypothetical protein [Bradyrhizobium sp.]
MGMIVDAFPGVPAVPGYAMLHPGYLLDPLVADVPKLRG